MKTLIVSANADDAIPHALEILNNGGLVAFPTDTVYGVGALASDGKAIESIYIAKDRPIEKAIPILIADADDMDKVGMNIPTVAREIAKRFFPGPLTCVIPKQPTLPSAVSATSTVGVRVPDHDVARALLRAAGPMAVTSANISGQPSPSTAEEVFAQLNRRIELIIDGGKTPGGVASTVVDCTTDKLKILREGPISLEEIRKKLSSPI
ncbi:MAG: Threonylcarbamoyl-AMP synthase [Anaerolineales bacterium]|nr:Threonylcarbamoyl-AMP synthase [Anaerolineales bacterium]